MRRVIQFSPRTSSRTIGASSAYCTFRYSMTQMPTSNSTELPCHIVGMVGCQMLYQRPMSASSLVERDRREVHPRRPAHLVFAVDVLLVPLRELLELLVREAQQLGSVSE